MDVNVFQRVWVLLELRVHFHDDVILIELCVDRRDLALAESVVEGVVDIGRKNAETRGGVTVDDDVKQQAASETVVCHISQLRKILEALLKLWNPGVEFFRVNIFKTVLKLRSTDAVFNRKVLYGLHEERNAINFFELRLKAADCVTCADFALRQRLQIHLDSAGVKRRVGAVNANERRKAFDGGIMQYHFGELLLMRGHRVKRNGLRRF